MSWGTRCLRRDRGGETRPRRGDGKPPGLRGRRLARLSGGGVWGLLPERNCASRPSVGPSLARLGSSKLRATRRNRPKRAAGYHPPDELLNAGTGTALRQCGAPQWIAPRSPGSERVFSPGCQYTVHERAGGEVPIAPPELRYGSKPTTSIKGHEGLCYFRLSKPWAHFHVRGPRWGQAQLCYGQRGARATSEQALIQFPAAARARRGVGSHGRHNEDPNAERGDTPRAPGGGTR